MKSSNQELAADKRPFTQVRSREMGATSEDAKRSLRVPLNHFQSGKSPRGLWAAYHMPAFVWYVFPRWNRPFERQDAYSQNCLEYFLVSHGESELKRRRAARAFQQSCPGPQPWWRYNPEEASLHFSLLRLLLLLFSPSPLTVAFARRGKKKKEKGKKKRQALKSIPLWIKQPLNPISVKRDRVSMRVVP